MNRVISSLGFSVQQQTRLGRSKRMGQHRGMLTPEERARITELQNVLIERFVEQREAVADGQEERVKAVSTVSRSVGDRSARNKPGVYDRAKPSVTTNAITAHHQFFHLLINFINRFPPTTGLARIRMRASAYAARWNRIGRSRRLGSRKAEPIIAPYRARSFAVCEFWRGRDRFTGQMLH